MPKKAPKAEDTKLPRIEIEPDIVYRRNGPVRVQATVFEQDPLYPGQTRRRGEVFVFEQPKKWTSDEQVLAAVQALFPHCAVVWVPDQPVV